ncbi:hypothetical protein Tco_0832346 [Tanacetum coccineum]
MSADKEEYCDERWSIGWRYKGDKAGYVCREDTDDEEADEECNGCVKAADYSDEESITENGDFVKEEDYTEDKALYCDEGWFIGWKV